MHTITAADLTAGTAIIAGHGYGEAPARVISVHMGGRSRYGQVVLSDGPGARTRTLTVARDDRFTVAPW